MKYVIADKALANMVGYQPATHRVNGNLIVLNEKEIMNNNILKGITLEDKVKSINGSIFTNSQMKKQMQEGGWND